MLSLNEHRKSPHSLSLIYSSWFDYHFFFLVTLPAILLVANQQHLFTHFPFF